MPVSLLMIDSEHPNWVRILADHSSTGAWAREGWPIDLDELPISPAQAAQIAAWQLRYEANRDWDGDHSFDVETSAREGLAIAREVKRELPRWTVIYFDEWAYKQDRDGLREIYEYEISGVASV